MVGFKNCFGVYSFSWKTFIFYSSFNSDFWFWLFWVYFYFLGPWWAIFGVGEGFKNWFGVYSCSWTTFIFYVSFNSEIWFWLTFGGHFFIFGGPHGLFLGFGVGLKNCFEVYLYSWTILSMYVSVNSDICFCLILGYFLTFWGLKRLFWGWGRVWQLFWGLLM